MAATPPTQGPGAMPSRPPLSVVPGGAPPPGIPGGAPPPPMAGLPPGPPPGAGPGPGPASNPLNAFMAAFLTDVSASLPPGWQCVDIAATALKIAIRAKEMQKATATVATLQSCLNTLTTLIDARTTGSMSTGANAPTVSGGSPDTGAADADSQPAAPSEPDSGGDTSQ